MSNDFYRFAEEFSTEIENVIKAELSKRTIFERLGFALFMPLTIDVIADQGAVSLIVLKDGTVKRREHLPSKPDILIQVNFETLRNLFYSRNKIQFLQAEKEKKIKITSSSLKGQQAERKIRELLGC